MALDAQPARTDPGDHEQLDLLANLAMNSTMGHEEDFRMATMNVSLSDEQKRQAKQDLEIKLREALLSGPAEPMTGEDWDKLERCIWERHHQVQPKP
jgi:hypothetical protein